MRDDEDDTLRYTAVTDYIFPIHFLYSIQQMQGIHLRYVFDSNFQAGAEPSITTFLHVHAEQLWVSDSQPDQ